MPDESLPDAEQSLPEQLRRVATALASPETRPAIIAAAQELERRAGRICELYAEVARLRTDVRDERRARVEAEVQADVELEEARAEVARVRGLAEQAWGPDAACVERRRPPAPGAGRADLPRGCTVTGHATHATATCWCDWSQTAATIEAARAAAIQHARMDAWCRIRCLTWGIAVVRMGWR